MLRSSPDLLLCMTKNCGWRYELLSFINPDIFQSAASQVFSFFAQLLCQFLGFILALPVLWGVVGVGVMNHAVIPQHNHMFCMWNKVYFLTAIIMLTQMDTTIVNKFLRRNWKATLVILISSCSCSCSQILFVLLSVLLVIPKFVAYCTLILSVHLNHFMFTFVHFCSMESLH